jgi:cytochrome b
VPPPTKVWDRPVRLLHWALVLTVATSAASLWLPLGLHQPAGYMALAAVVLRVLWGLAGGTRSNPARFAQFVRAPRATLAYARALLQRREPRHVGHNPLGAWMVLALLACVLGLALTGWLYTSDVLWGDERVEQMHGALAWALLVLVVLHLAGVVLTSLRHRENLVRAMFDGKKRPAENTDIA